METIAGGSRPLPLVLSPYPPPSRPVSRSEPLQQAPAGSSACPAPFLDALLGSVEAYKHAPRMAPHTLTFPSVCGSDAPCSLSVMLTTNRSDAEVEDFAAKSGHGAMGGDFTRRVLVHSLGAGCGSKRERDGAYARLVDVSLALVKRDVLEQAQQQEQHTTRASLRVVPAHADGVQVLVGEVHARRKAARGAVGKKWGYFSKFA
ncbi:hypothetical protein TeGR_g10646 [Tetraparma gracilis]|jgi:hypothetical protein|uniref:Uncharacterized protein n=1 Tax=Tetraparma gracilis TaxID=2962635 RepID=A0ABQ6N5T8_9STRA|nr:hypothetical protein TeGR_g10646 [Tetraparma gracilis]